MVNSHSQYTGHDAVRRTQLQPATLAELQRHLEGGLDCPGVEGSAYLVGGIGINYQQRDDIVLAPMRSGVGIRLGASVGYLKYTKSREWLPF